MRFFYLIIVFSSLRVDYICVFALNLIEETMQHDSNAFMSKHFSRKKTIWMSFVYKVVQATLVITYGERLRLLNKRFPMEIAQSIRKIPKSERKFHFGM